MENLFDLIFENFWVLIILFGIISSFFGGDKKQQNKKPYSETTQMPTMTPVKQAEPEQKPSYAKKVQEVAVQAQKQQVMEKLSTAQASLAAKAEQLPRKSHNLNRQLPDEKVTQGTFSQNEVVNGIIMAEILGAPRAKKPYSKSRR